MKKVNVFFAEGFEEVEALTVVDILRRVGIETFMVSVTGEKMVKGAHGIKIEMDKTFNVVADADAIVLPGGMPGTLNLKAHEGLRKLIEDYNEKGKLLCAICAAPTVYGSMGLLKERHATCYPGMEAELDCVEALTDAVVIDDNFITSRGMGTAIEFSLAIVRNLIDDETADELASKIVYEQTRES
ncbi:MAG: DJ-1/PfpI family protein [Lachnospiraceae bacterium]|nr:DJ-1/PfpI family protein [Lachnospiraceae bacterium]